jgi:hypothetical protein
MDVTDFVITKLVLDLSDNQWGYAMEFEGTVEFEQLPFYIVLRDLNKPNATKRHATFEEAKKEAERLSRKEKARFYVCTVTVDGYTEPEETPVKWTPI